MEINKHNYRSRAGGCSTAANGKAARPLGQQHSSRGQTVKKIKKKGEEQWKLIHQHALNVNLMYKSFSSIQK